MRRGKELLSCRPNPHIADTFRIYIYTCVFSRKSFSFQYNFGGDHNPDKVKDYSHEKTVKSTIDNF